MSRYYAYTEDSYKELVTCLEKEETLSVGVIDMDWHLVEDVIRNTEAADGLHLNKNYFPDPNVL